MELLRQWETHLQSLGKKVASVSAAIAFYKTPHEQHDAATGTALTLSIMERLTGEINSIFDSTHISEAEEERRRMVAAQLQRAFRREPNWSQCEVLLVGSSLSKFGSNTSDLDLSDLDLCLCRKPPTNEGGLSALAAEFKARNLVFTKRVDDDSDGYEPTIHGQNHDPVFLNKTLANSLQYLDAATDQWHRAIHESTLTQQRLAARIAHWQGLVAALYYYFQQFPEPTYWDPNPQPSTFTNNSGLHNLRLRRRGDLDNAADLLRRFGCNVREVVSGARVPVIKFTHPAAAYACDLCLENHDTYLNSMLLRSYAEFADRARSLSIAVKHWAKQRGLSHAPTGFINSYSFVLLTIFFLQTKAKILPNLQHPELLRQANVAPIMINGVDVAFCTDQDQARAFHLAQHPEPLTQSVGELLHSFFQFYVEEFDCIERVVSVRHPERELSKSACWGGKSNFKAWRISIVDPVDVLRDLGDVMYFWSQVRIFNEMKRALTLLRDGESFQTRVCETAPTKK